jgi:hypothetical protein
VPDRALDPASRRRSRPGGRERHRAAPPWRPPLRRGGRSRTSCRSSTSSARRRAGTARRSRSARVRSRGCRARPDPRPLRPGYSSRPNGPTVQSACSARSG